MLLNDSQFFQVSKGSLRSSSWIIVILTSSVDEVIHGMNTIESLTYWSIDRWIDSD